MMSGICRPSDSSLDEEECDDSEPTSERLERKSHEKDHLLLEIDDLTKTENAEDGEQDTLLGTRVNRSNLTMGRMLMGHGIGSACATMAMQFLGFLVKTLANESEFQKCPYARHGAAIMVGACCVGLVTILGGVFLAATANGICVEALSNAEDLELGVNYKLLVAIHEAQGELTRLRIMMQITWILTGVSVLATGVGCAYDGVATLTC
eukprot:m.453026 g.453026  ORF g.453026 m.453026 type:complete len:208 (-) comp20426_c0_seq1:63-686(-)